MAHSSVAGVLVTLAIFYWQEQRNSFDLAISLEDEVNLIEVREAVPELKITYHDEDLLKSKRAIKLARIKLQNKGETILQSFFDRNIPFELRFPGARVLDATIEETNSDYLRNNLLPSKGNIDAGKTEDTKDFVLLNPVIFERNKFASLKVYLLQEVSGPVKITTTGKIANIDTLNVVKETKMDSSPAQFSNTESIKVFFVAYGGIFAGMFSIFGTTVLVDWIRDRRKNKILVQFIDRDQNLSEEEIAAVGVLATDLSPFNRRLFIACAKNQEAFDLREFVQTRIEIFARNPIRRISPSFFSRIQRMAFVALPPEIFAYESGRVRLNPANKDILIRFGKVLGLLP